jgi:protein SCO1/2
MKSWVGVIFLALAFAGCQSTPPQGSTTQTPATYSGHGVVLKISADHHLVTIHHQNIPGYMMEMTMDFPVRDEQVLTGLTPGDQIDFTLTENDNDAWISAARRTGHSDLPPETPAPSATIQPGELVPDSELTDEHGQKIHLSNFRGKVLVFTFFFTRCPLPNYCPLMNHNMAETRSLLESKPDGPKNWQFLSISFDPDFDTSQALSTYAAFYRKGDPTHWLFASAGNESLAKLAQSVGLTIMASDGTISHNLRTVIIDPTGHLFSQFNDNTWTPGQLFDAVKGAASHAKPASP